MFPFAGIVDIKDLPEIPPDAQMRLKLVWHKDLYLTQDKVQIKQLFFDFNTLSDETFFGTVGVVDGKYYLYNGHHRTIKRAMEFNNFGNFYVYEF